MPNALNLNSLNKDMIYNTIIRLVTALSSLWIMVLISRSLGANGRGETAFFILNISLLQIIHFIFGGTVLALIKNKIKAELSLIISSIWILVINILAVPLIGFYYNYDISYLLFLFFASFYSSYLQNLLSLFQAHKNFKVFNALNLVQVLSYTLLIFIYTIIGSQKIEFVFFSILLSYLLASILGQIQLKKIDSNPLIQFKIKEIIKYGVQKGLLIQGANLSQFLTYRISYFFILASLDQSSLGIYSNGIALAEGLWIFSKSISSIQFAQVLNEKSNIKNIIYSLKLLIPAFILSLFGVIVLNSIPENWYLEILGMDFKGIKQVIMYLSPGIILLSLNHILSSYFSASGKNHINTINSIINLLITLILIQPLITKYKINGAAITASVSYLAGFLIFIFLIAREYTQNKKALNK